MNKIKDKTIQQWLPIQEIYNDGIVKLKNKYIKILKIIPINYNLKSDSEKEAILNSYKIFLKTCNFDIQIFIKMMPHILKMVLFVLRIIFRADPVDFRILIIM